MKKIISLFVIASVPVFIFLTVWQVYQYESVKNEIALLEEEQSELFEKNKQMVANIAILSSPARIEKLAAEELDLKKSSPMRTIHVKFPGSKKDG